MKLIKMNYKLALMALVFALVLPGCSSDEPVTPDNEGENTETGGGSHENEQYEHWIVLNSREKEIAQAFRTTSFDLYKLVDEMHPDENFGFSPFQFLYAMSFIAYAANDEVGRKILDTLGFEDFSPREIVEFAGRMRIEFNYRDPCATQLLYGKIFHNSKFHQEYTGLGGELRGDYAFPYNEIRGFTDAREYLDWVAEAMNFDSDVTYLPFELDMDAPYLFTWLQSEYYVPDCEVDDRWFPHDDNSSTLIPFVWFYTRIPPGQESAKYNCTLQEGLRFYIAFFQPREGEDVHTMFDGIVTDENLLDNTKGDPNMTAFPAHKIEYAIDYMTLLDKLGLKEVIESPGALDKLYTTPGVKNQYFLQELIHTRFGTGENRKHDLTNEYPHGEELLVNRPFAYTIYSHAGGGIPIIMCKVIHPML